MGWISVILQLVPSLVALFGDDTANRITDAGTKAIDTIKKATGASTPEEAKTKIQQDSQISDTLKIQLAQIAADAEAKKRQDELANLQAQFAEQDKARQAQLEALGKSLEDVKNARGTFATLAASGSKFAWGAPVVSAIVTLGFFAILAVLIFRGFPNEDAQKLQVLNVILGTLATAFTTVVTFWVGSSQGSRNKDDATFQLQSQQVQQTSDALKAQTDTALQIAKQQARPADSAAQTPTKADNNFGRCIDVILKWEGGYTNDPQDPGGATNWGITLNELKIWRENQSLTAVDVQNLKKDEAIEIFRSNYWNKMRCDDLPAGVDLVVFDFGVNAGISRSAKMLQLVVGANQDGSVGPATIAATNAQDPIAVVKSMTEKRLAYYQSLPGWGHFGKGWSNRTNDVGQIALQMAGG
jgi:hypothetical protein